MRRHINLLVFLFFLATGFLTFANSLHNPFMIDDHRFFDEKKRNIKYLWYQFIPEKDWNLGLGDNQTDSYYRPIVKVVLMFSFLAFGNNVVGYHALNIFLLVLAAWLIFVFLNALFDDALLAFGAALMYLIHPINGIVPNYVTASAFAIQTILMLASLFFLIRDNKVLSIFFFIMSLFSHETSMALPLYATIILMTARRQTWQQAWKATWSLWLTLAVYLVWRSQHAGLSHSILGNFSVYHKDFFEHAATLSKLIVWYLVRLFYPVGILMMKSQNVLQDALGIAFWVGTLVSLAAGWMWLAWTARRSPGALTGLCWFAFGFLPFCFVTLFCSGQGMMLMEPHWFIFSVIGFFLWLAAMMRALWKETHQRTILLGIAVVITCWIAASEAMNKIWDGDINYCRYWVSESPGFSDPVFDLATAYQVNGRYEQARYWYAKALALGCRPEIIYLNLGYLDIMESRWDDAKEHLNKSLAIFPYTATAVSDLGIIAFIEKDYAKAQQYFLRAIALDNLAELPRLNLGKVYLLTGKPNEAVRAFEDILTITPNDELALKELMAIYWQQGEKTQALKIGKQIMKVSRNPLLLVQVGMMAQQSGDMPMAMRIYHLLIRIAPNGRIQPQDTLPGVTGLISAKRI